jgi:spermidine synthase
MSEANASPTGRSHQEMSEANASPTGRSHQEMSEANASPTGRSHQEMSEANASPTGRSHQEMSEVSTEARKWLDSRSVLYVIFFLSGVTGLVYEVIWVRMTGLVFGNTSHAISIVLGAFMAGLALGSWKLGQTADRTTNPLRLYGLLEVGIGLSAALVPLVFRELDSFYWTIAPTVASIPGGAGLIRFVTSFVVLITPTFLMGGTLPVLTRFFTDRIEEVERKVGVLYALNTFGAAAGSLLAALVLIPGIGNTRTTLIIATVNVAIGLFAMWLSGRPAGSTSSSRISGDEGAAPSSPSSSNPIVDRLVLMTLAVSGFVSMMYEVSWTRALSAMIGSSTYAFSIMLVTFLIGIALGSSIISRWKPVASLRLLGLLQLGVAFGGMVFLLGYLAAPYTLLALIRAFYYSFPAILTIQFILCAALMILATLSMGASFPIASQLYSSKFLILGRSIGNIYSVNTIGAIIGSLVAGFVLMPLIGTERTILAGLFFNAAMALLLLTEAKTARFAQALATVLLLIATVSMRGGIFWKPDAMDRGVLIYSKALEARPELTMSEHYEDTDVVYFKEGNNATISVRKGENYMALRTNGKVDASNRDDMITQLTVGWLPGFYHPNPKNALVIGYGSGVTVGAVTSIKEIEDIDCIEIEPAVYAAGPWFSEINRKSYENPRVHFTFNDARNYMNTTRKKYDIIISEPSNPWIAGVASLFTSEFYDRAAEVLNPDGVFAQWIQLYELDPEDLRMVLYEVQRKFPEVSVWVTDSDLIMIATRQKQTLDTARIAKIVKSDPSMVRDFREFLHSETPEGLLSYYVMSTEAVRKFASKARRNTDDHPLLEFHAPRRLFADTRDLNIDLLYESKDGLLPQGAEVNDLEAAYAGMIEPLLAFKRSHLANQAMALLAQVPKKEEASLQLAIAKLKMDSADWEGAEEALKQADSQIKSDSPIMGEKEEMMGLLYESLGNLDEAKKHFERSVKVEPKRPLPLRRLAELAAKDQSWTDASNWMQQYLETKPPQLAHYWAVLGDYRLAAEEIEAGSQALETALRLDPYVYWAHFRMARVFEKNKDTESAIKQYEFLVRYAFDRDPDIYVKLATLYKDAGRKRDALRVLEKGRRILATNPAIYRLYREVLDAS